MRLSRVHMRQMAYFGGITGTISAVSMLVAVYGVVGWGAQIGAVFLIVNYTCGRDRWGVVEVGGCGRRPRAGRAPACQ